MHCSRCGGTSQCHTGQYKNGPCHIACGPEGDDVTAALTEVRRALDGDDVATLVLALGNRRAGVSVEFVPEAGRIDFVLPCNPTKVYRTLAVLPEKREELEAELRARGALALGGSP